MVLATCVSMLEDWRIPVQLMLEELFRCKMPGVQLRSIHSLRTRMTLPHAKQRTSIWYPLYGGDDGGAKLISMPHKIGRKIDIQDVDARGARQNKVQAFSGMESCVARAIARRVWSLKSFKNTLNLKLPVSRHKS